MDSTEWSKPQDNVTLYIRSFVLFGRELGA